MFIILETQTYLDGAVGTLIDTYANQNEAESKYHAVLSAAAVSNVPRHTAFMRTDDGYVVKSECYKHEVQPEPESEEQDG